MFKRIIVLSLILATAIYANDEVEVRLNESVITAQNFKTTVRNTASNVTIVTAKDIEEKGAQNLVDALRMVPGVMVKNYYGNITFDIGGYSSVHAERNSIITYDGVRISSKEATNIPISSIERVEVIPNGGGILYGDGANGGVINILSKNIYGKNSNKKVSGNVRTEYGSRGSYKYGLSTNAKATDRLTFQVDYSKDKYRSERNSDENGKIVSRSQEVSVDAKYKFDNADLVVKYTRNEKHRADGGDLEEADYYKDRKMVSWAARDFTRSNDWYINYRQNIGDNTELLTYVDLYDSKENDDVTKILDRDYARKTVKLQLKHKYFNNHYFIVGADYMNEKLKGLDSNGGYTGRNTEKTDYGVFTINELKFGKFTFAQGLRFNKAKYDFYWREKYPVPRNIRGEHGEQEYKNYAANLELRYDYSNTGMVYGKWSRDFRTPLAREMYYTLDGSKLKAQTQNTFEIGVKDYIAGSYVSLSTFYKKTNGEIYYEGTPNKESTRPGAVVFPYYNMGDTRRIGVELLTQQYLNNFTFTESVSYLNHKIVDSDFESRKGKEIPMVPNWKLGFGIGYKFNDKLNLNADIIYYGKFYDSDDPENIRPKDKGNYATVSVSANYKFENGFALNARVNNLFDRKYEDYVGYWDGTRQYSPATGRYYSIGVSYTF